MIYPVCESKHRRRSSLPSLSSSFAFRCDGAQEEPEQALEPVETEAAEIASILSPRPPRYQQWAAAPVPSTAAMLHEGPTRSFFPE